MALLENAPTGFTATNSSSSAIALSWVNGESLPIEIQRKASSGTYGTIYITGSAETVYDDTTCSSNSLYYYRIRYNSGVDVSGWTIAYAYTNPAPPTGLAVAWSGKTATLTWTNGNTYTYVKVYYKLSADSAWATDTVTLTGTLTTSAITVATENVNYDFRICGYLLASTLNSTYNTVTASTSLMLAPTGMTLSCASTTSVTVTWVEPSAVATHYEVWMDGALLADGTVAAGTATLTESGLTISTTYAFKIRAKLGTAYSLFNTETEIDTGVAPDQPAVIGAITVVSSSALTVAWTCSATNETGFKAYRSTNGTDYTLINTGTTANATSYADTGLDSYTLYYYRVQAYNSYGISAMSSAVSGTTLIDLDPPSGLYAEATSSTRITLTYTVNSGDATSHYVENKAAGATYTVPGTEIADETATTYVHGSLVANTEYTFRMRAYSSVSRTYGDYSVPITKKTLSIGTDTVRRNEAYFAMWNVLCIASETPQNSFEAKWTSKPIDFSEADQSDANKNKTVYLVQLEYDDTYASVPVVVSLSNDGGTTWTTSSETVGTGDLTSKIKDFHFSGVTGKNITLKISCTSSTVGFTWTGIIIHYVSRGEWAEAT
jgi:titin